MRFVMPPSDPSSFQSDESTTGISGSLAFTGAEVELALWIIALVTITGAVLLVVSFLRERRARAGRWFPRRARKPLGSHR